jgi:hypothetical protein
MQPIVNAVLASSLATDVPIHSKEQLDSTVLARCALLAKADELLIPAAEDDVLTKFIKTLPGLHDEKNTFSSEKYAAFLENCERIGLSKAEVKAALLDDLRISTLIRVIFGDGIACERQLQRALTLLYSEYNLAVAKLHYSTFLPEIIISDDDLQKFYEKHPEKYRVPEMVAVSAVRFNYAQFENDLQVPDGRVLREYFTAESESFKAYADFESARDAVVERYMKFSARKLAGQSADRFVCELYASGIELNSDKWQDLLLQFGVKKEKIAAYSKLKLPIVEDIPEAALVEVCDMDPYRYYSDPIMTDSGAVVLIAEGRREAHILPFDEVREYVERNAREEQRSERFDALVKKIKSSITLPTHESVINRCSEFNMTPEFFNGVSLGNNVSELDGRYWAALNSAKGNGCVCTAKIKDGVAFIIIMGHRVPPYADMAARNCGEIEKKLQMFDRDFCLSEYVGWLINTGLNGIK